MSDGTNTIHLTVTSTAKAPKRYAVEFFDGATEYMDELPPLHDPFWSMAFRVTETVVSGKGPITVGVSSGTN